MRIVVGGISHQRATVESYLRHMAALRVPPGAEVEYLWVADGDVGATIRDILPHAAQINVRGVTESARYARKEPNKQRAYQRLGYLRDLLGATALEMGCDALVAVDSDIIVPPDLIERLAEVGLPWVGALVRNTPEFLRYGTRPSVHLEDSAWNVLTVPPPRTGRPLFQHFKPIGDDGLGNVWPTAVIGWMPQDSSREPRLVTGAVAWYSRELLGKAHWSCLVAGPADLCGCQCNGEDIAFGLRALDAGFSAWYIPLICEHLMDETAMEAHRASCPTCHSPA